MQTTLFIFFTLFLIVACSHPKTFTRSKPVWLEGLQGWQKGFGIAAFLLALLIFMNPEFLALGLLGDAALFDALVLALSLQFQTIAFRMLRSIQSAFANVISFVIWRARRTYLFVLFFLNPLDDLLSTTRKAMRCISLRA